jgi:hypothetical protein
MGVKKDRGAQRDRKKVFLFLWGSPILWGEPFFVGEARKNAKTKNQNIFFG